MKKPTILTFYFAKGGVGKSRLTILVANYYAAIGKKVAVIDIDSSTHSSTDYYMLEENIDIARKEKNVAKLFFDTENNINDYVLNTNHENVWLCPASRGLCSMRTMNENTFKKVLMKEGDFDYILIDCSPSYDNFSINAIRCADYTISPCLQDNDSFGDAFSLMGDYQNEIEHKLPNWLILINGYNMKFKDAVTGKQQEYISRYEEHFKDHLMPRECWLPWTKAMNDVRDRGMKLSKVKSKDSDTICNETLFDSIKNICECFIEEETIAEPASF